MCTIAMLLECTNVVLSSQRENKEHLIDYEKTVERVLPVRNINAERAWSSSIQPGREQQVTHDMYLSETSVH